MKTPFSKKKKLNITGIIIVLIALCIGGSLAYFYDDDSVRTMFVTGEYDSIKVHLIEPEWKSEDQGLNSMPGDNIPADPAIVNDEDPVYMRVVIFLTDMETGEVITGSRANKIWSMIHYIDKTNEELALYVQNPMTESQMTALPWINESEFVYDEGRSDTVNGIYYFNYVGGEDEWYGILDTDQAATLYNYVIVPIDWSREEIQYVGNFKVNIQGEALHAENYELGLEEEITSPEQAFRLLHKAMTE